MKQYKAFISDLDGTLIPNRLDGRPSPKVIEAITKAKEKIHVSIATGRRLSQAAPILDDLNVSGPSILLNGALIIDSTSRKPLFEQPMLQKDLTFVTDVLKKTNLLFTIDNHEQIFEGHTNQPVENPLTVFVEDMPESEADILIRHFAHIPTLALYKVKSWEKGKVCVNISHALATKQHAIFEVAKMLKIETHEIIGIGDGPNDFPLLMACGLKVAIGNANEDLKAIADYVAPTVEEDGVAHVIEKFILT